MICDLLGIVNTTSIEEIELYIEVVQVKPQVNQSVGAYTDLLVGVNDNVAELDYGCGLVALQHLILINVKYMEMIKTVCDALIPGCLVDNPSTYGIIVDVG